MAGQMLRLKPLAESGIKILQETDYPSNGAVKITLSLKKSEKFRLNLRIPRWSANTAVKVNGNSG